MSFAPEVIADRTGQWCGNALRFATREEAQANVADLASRWMLVQKTRVVESTDPVNYSYVGGILKAVDRCAGCGEIYPCSDSKRTDIRDVERAKHFVKQPEGQ